MNRLTLILIAVIALAAFTGAVSGQEGTDTPTSETTTETPQEETETATETETEASDDEEEVEEEIDTIVKDVSTTLNVVSEEWESDRLVLIVDSSRQTDSIWISENLDDGDFTWESYDVSRGQTRIVYQFEGDNVGQIGIASMADEDGTTLSSPTASVFSRPSRWGDHPITYVSTAGAFLCVLLYRYRKTKFWENRELHSILD